MTGDWSEAGEASTILWYEVPGLPTHTALPSLLAWSTAPPPPPFPFFFSYHDYKCMAQTLKVFFRSLEL